MILHICIFMSLCVRVYATWTHNTSSPGTCIHVHMDRQHVINILFLIGNSKKMLRCEQVFLLFLQIFGVQHVFGVLVSFFVFNTVANFCCIVLQGKCSSYLVEMASVESVSPYF